MPHASSNYLSLENLVNSWANQSGELPLLTLRRIADWAVCEGFPHGTFSFADGKSVHPLDLHHAMRLELGEPAPIGRSQANHILSETMISKNGVKSFCDRFDVRPVPEMRDLRTIAGQLLRRPKHLGPPDCPDGFQVAARLEAKLSAFLALADLNGFIDRVKSRSENGISGTDIENWNSQLERLKPNIALSGDQQLREELAHLSKQWDALTTLTSGTANNLDQPERPTVLEPEQSIAPPERPEKRSVGRPKGSGSTEQHDLTLVDEMRAAIVSGRHTSFRAAARELVGRALGGGTEESKEKRLRTRYAQQYPG